LRRSLPARDVGAAIRAIREERIAALRTLSDRRTAAQLAFRERRMIERGAPLPACQGGRSDARLWSITSEAPNSM
jgi:hypothetical protein